MKGEEESDCSPLLSVVQALASSPAQLADPTSSDPPFETPWFRLTACYDPRPRSPDSRPRTLGAVRSRRFGPGHLPSYDGALVLASHYEPPLYGEAVTGRVMKEQKNKVETNWAALASSPMTRETGRQGKRIFSKPRKLQDLQSRQGRATTVLVPGSTGLADKRPPNTAMLQVRARPGRLSAP